MRFCDFDSTWLPEVMSWFEGVTKVGLCWTLDTDVFLDSRRCETWHGTSPGQGVRHGGKSDNQGELSSGCASLLGNTSHPGMI